MTKTLIFTITALTILITFQQINALPEVNDEVLVEFEHGDTKPIPNWVDQNFRWYGEGQISQTELLNALSFLLDNNIMFISEDAARNVQQLKEENAQLKMKLGVNQEDNNSIESGKLIETSRDDDEPIPYSCDGMACECEGSDDCWNMILSDSCHNDKLWCDDNEDGSYGCVCWESSTGDESGEFWFEGLKPGNVQLGGNGDVIIIGGYTKPTTSNFEFASQIVEEILKKDGTASAWQDGITAFSQHGLRESVSPDLQGIVVLCNIEIDKKVQQIDAEIKIIEQWLDIITQKQENSSYDASGRITTETNPEYTVQYRESDLDFISRKLTKIDQQIKALDTGISILQQKLTSLNGDAQLMNLDLQNSLQKQQQKLQTISNVQKVQHDTAMSIIQNMR